MLARKVAPPAAPHLYSHLTIKTAMFISVRSMVRLACDVTCAKHHERLNVCPLLSAESYCLQASKLASFALIQISLLVREKSDMCTPPLFYKTYFVRDGAIIKRRGFDWTERDHMAGCPWTRMHLSWNAIHARAWDHKQLQHFDLCDYL